MRGTYFTTALRINNQAADYTANILDWEQDTITRMTSGSANNYTIPLNSSVPFPIGTQLIVAQVGTGQTTIVATSGVTINATGLKISATKNAVTLIKVGTDEWSAFGNLDVAYTARTTAFATATAITDTTILNALNTFDLGLISNGLDTKMKAVYPFVGSTATTQKYNFMDARDLDIAYRLQFNGGWVFSNTGALSNGTNGYADTFLNGNSVLVANNTHVSIYVNNNLTGLTAAPGFGAFLDLTSAFYTHLRLSNNYYSFIGSENGSASYGNTYSNTDNSGYYISSRTSSTSMKAYKNNVLKNTTTLTNTANLPPINFTFGGTRNGNNIIAPSTWNNYSHTFASLGNGLSDTDASNLYTLVQAMQVSLARNV